MSEAVARAVAGLVNAKRVFIQTGYCPKCLKGGASKARDIPKTGRTEFWRELMADKEIDVYQALHMYVPGQGSIPRFKEALKSPFKPGEPCADQGQCVRTCFFCHYMIEDEEYLRMPVGDHAFSVHTLCVSQCSHVPIGRTRRERCVNQVPIVPRYAKAAGFDTNYCRHHAQLAAEAATGRTEGRVTMMVPQNPSPRGAPPAMADSPRLQGAPAPKAAPKPHRPTKLERDSERGRSRDIKAMFGSRPAEDPKPANPPPYERPVVVFTPHAPGYRRRAFDFRP